MPGLQSALPAPSIRGQSSMHFARGGPGSFPRHGLRGETQYWQRIVALPKCMVCRGLHAAQTLGLASNLQLNDIALRKRGL